MSKLMELAAKARTMQAAGAQHADLALVGEVLTVEDRTAIQQLALSGDGEAARELEQLDGAEIAIFTDAFARNAYLRKQVAQLAKDDAPNLDEVISRLFALQAKTMPAKKGQMLPAIPLLTVHRRFQDAKKHLCGDQPIVLFEAWRKSKGKKDEHIEARTEQYLVPATALDRETFRQFKQILAKAADVLTAQLDDGATMTLRQIVWYAVHFLPQSQIMTPKWLGRIFDKQEDGSWKHRNNHRNYLRFDLSGHEVYLVPKSDRASRLMEQLKAIAES
jgi:hypothetical protein